MKLFVIINILTLFNLLWALPMPREYEEKYPELTAGYVEGDMVLDVTQRNGLRDRKYRWPNNIVYYKFSSEINQDQKNLIWRAMQILESVSCIRFKEATANTYTYVNITSRYGGCYSSVGYSNSGPRVYNLDNGCFALGTIVHEFLHTLGFFHMQSASNRDDYVRIARENIIRGMEHNFEKYDSSLVYDFGEEYDYGSIMHYPASAFSANGRMTIIPLKPEAASIMGQRTRMSRSDIIKLNRMYGCQKYI